MSKPKVSSAKWYKMWEQDDAVCYYDENNLSFLKLKLPNQRVKYFYGEMAHRSEEHTSELQSPCTRMPSSA